MFTSNAYDTEKCGVDLTCHLTSTFIDDSEEMRYTTYGIQVKRKNGNVVLEQADISTDQARVERLISLYEKYHVSFLHIMDVLEDYLD